ncbi:hypothetical protein QCA50_015929 [Cerrena zonata]|uniref:VASt domain-containing protein n=1 Tax=Cerrena zonata TaxID=2478898 RepID=A0AAW0FUU1_9APHY
MNIDVDDDDAWSYSFPPSTESLPILKDASNEKDQQTTSKQPNGLAEKEKSMQDKPLSSESKVSTKSDSKVQSNPKIDDGSIDEKATSNGSEAKDIGSIGNADKGDNEINDSNDNNDNASGSSSDLSNNRNPDIKRRREQLKAFAPGSSTNSSLSSMSLQSPFLVKSVPANPYTTREDANSILSKESKPNSLGEKDKQKDQIISPKSAAMENMRYAMQLQASDATINGNTDQRPSIDTESLKSKTTPDLSKADENQATTMPTQILYAIMKRNTDFHQLFRNLDLTDRLLDDFACALSREILLQGRIYISEHNICFNSNLLGWVTNLAIPMDDIIRFEKKTTAGLFPNGIMIQTKTEKHSFASFLSRDMTFDFMVSVWEGTTGKSLKSVNDILSTTSDNENVQSDPSHRRVSSESGKKFDAYMLSVDDDADHNNQDGDGEINDSDDVSLDDSDNDDLSDGSSDMIPDSTSASPHKSIADSKGGLVTVDTKVLKFKPDCGYTNMGPEIHTPTSFENHDRESNEVDLCNEIINAPVGIVYDILFGSSNTSFHKQFLEDHDASEISDYDKFHPMESDPTKLERKYFYKRALNYSVGPKSTKCESVVATPDVPLGNSFTVVTRYCFTWGPDNTTNLKISYYINWTGRSWIKSLIEKSTAAGQESSVKDLLTTLKVEIDQNTYLVDGPTIVKPTTQEDASQEPKKVVRSKSAKKSLADYDGKVQDLTKDNEELWEWVKTKRGGKNLSHLEKAEYLAFQLNSLYNLDSPEESGSLSKTVKQAIFDTMNLIKGSDDNGPLDGLI